MPPQLTPRLLNSTPREGCLSLILNVRWPPLHGGSSKNFFNDSGVLGLEAGVARLLYAPPLAESANTSALSQRGPATPAESVYQSRRGTRPSERVVPYRSSTSQVRVLFQGWARSTQPFVPIAVG
ncbi:hypothetical protein TNCV_2355081 [Trichonephila clavipes]|nr:hypothetical protein TNCV_2355081 [Trichonephila clavipes]